jgi:hypothetical protein
MQQVEKFLDDDYQSELTKKPRKKLTYKRNCIPVQPQ